MSQGQSGLFGLTSLLRKKSGAGDATVRVNLSEKVD